MFGFGKNNNQQGVTLPNPEEDHENSIDVSLMEAAGLGDDYAFQSIVERHQRAVYGTVGKMIGNQSDIEDIAQQVFVRLWKSAPKYKPKAKFTTYLFTIVRNVVFTETKKNAKQKNSTSIDDTENIVLHIAEDSTSNPDEIMKTAELQLAIDNAIAKLPEDQRLAIVLRRYENLPYEEIATVLETTVSAVKSHLFRARTTLRISLKSYLAE